MGACHLRLSLALLLFLALRLFLHHLVLILFGLGLLSLLLGVITEVAAFFRVR